MTEPYTYLVLRYSPAPVDPERPHLTPDPSIWTISAVHADLGQAVAAYDAITHRKQRGTQYLYRLVRLPPPPRPLRRGRHSVVGLNTLGVLGGAVYVGQVDGEAVWWGIW